MRPLLPPKMLRMSRADLPDPGSTGCATDPEAGGARSSSSPSSRPRGRRRPSSTRSSTTSTSSSSHSPRAPSTRSSPQPKYMISPCPFVKIVSDLFCLCRCRMRTSSSFPRSLTPRRSFPSAGSGPRRGRTTLTRTPRTAPAAGRRAGRSRLWAATSAPTSTIWIASTRRSARYQG